MASFPRDKKSRYHRVIFRKKVKGEKEKSKTFYFRKDEFNRSEVQEWKNDREKEYRANEWLPWDQPGHVHKQHEITVEDSIRVYLRQAERQLAEDTYDMRRRYLNLMADLVGKKRPMADLPIDVISQWVNHPNIKYKTKMKRLESVRALYLYAYSKSIVAEIPKIEVLATRAEKKKAKRADKTWITPDEFDKVKKAAQNIHEYRLTRYRTHPAREFEREFSNIFDFLVNTGLRRKDLLNLSTDWLKGDMLKIGDDFYTPKSQEESEVIPLTHQAREIMIHWRNKYGEGVRPFNKVTPDWCTRFFKAVFEEALPRKAPKLSAHKMRDTAAMYLLFELSLSPQTVQQITRHEDLATLMLYTHRAPKLALVEINRANSALLENQENGKKAA